MICPKCNLRPLEPYRKAFFHEGKEVQELLYFSTCRQCNPTSFEDVFFQDEYGVWQDEEIRSDQQRGQYLDNVNKEFEKDLDHPDKRPKGYD